MYNMWKKCWRLWCKAIGEKPSQCDREADTVAWIRTFIFVSYLVTNVAIVANAVRHWNDVDYQQTCTTKQKHLQIVVFTLSVMYFG